MTSVARVAFCHAAKVVPRRSNVPEKGPGHAPSPVAPRKIGSPEEPRIRRPAEERNGRAGENSRDSMTKLRTIGDAVERARTNAERSVSKSAKRLALEIDVRAREAAERFAAGATDSAVDSVVPKCFAEEILLLDDCRKKMDDFWRESAGEWSTVGSERDEELARIRRIFEESEGSDGDGEVEGPREAEEKARERLKEKTERD
jgi:hypothetical protein